MPGTIAPFPKHVFLTNAGAPAASHQLFTYEAGTTTKLTTYTDSALSSANTNPIILDSSGRATIFLSPNKSYKFVFTTAGDSDPPTSPIWTVDNVLSLASSTVNVDIVGVAGVTLSTGDVVYLSDGSGGLTAGSWYKADADNIFSSTGASAIGFSTAVVANPVTDLATIRIDGRMTGLAGLTAGTVYYVSSTAGGLTATAPANAAPVGTADSSTSLVLRVTPAAISTVKSLVASPNVIKNGDFRLWTAGNTGAPDSWVLAGAGATILRTGPGEATTFSFETSQFAAQITRAGTDVTLTQDVIASGAFANFADVKGRRFSVSGKAFTSTAGSIGRIVIDDGATTTASDYVVQSVETHIMLTHKISDSAVKLSVVLQGNNTNAAVAFGGIQGAFSDLAPNDWSPDSSSAAPGTTATSTKGGRFFSSFTSAGNVGSGETTLVEPFYSPGTLDANGRYIRIFATGTFAANANTKTLRTYIGTGATTVFAVTTSGGTWWVNIYYVRTGAATQILRAMYAVASGATQAMVTSFPAETLANQLSLKLTGQSSAVSNDDIVLDYVRCELI